jgi:hypothetical protein
MESSRTVLRKVIFVAAAILYCAALSLRPIPKTTANNDTGRYIANQEDACRFAALADDSEALPQRAFNFVVRPACLGEENRVFLFFVAMLLPISFLLFGQWDHDAAVFLVLGLLASAVNFELSTNALRQSVSLAFLLASISLRGRVPRFVALACALLLHDSSWIFIPCVLYVNRRSPEMRKTKTRKLVIVLMLIMAGIVGFYTLDQRFGGQIQEGSSPIDLFTARYGDEASFAFIAFMIMPICWIYAARKLGSTAGVSREEKMTFYYSLAILAVTAILFPAITYRFAMTAMVLQLFMAMRAAELSINSGLQIFAGLFFHFLIYAGVSPNFWTVLNG